MSLSPAWLGLQQLWVLQWCPAWPLGSAVLYLYAGLETMCFQGSAGEEEVKPVFAMWHVVLVPPVCLE